MFVLVGGFSDSQPLPSVVSQSAIETQYYATGYGQQSEVTLADGSVLSLNWNTELTVLFSNERRSVSLAKGEAIFTVAKNPHRPFIVSVDDIRLIKWTKP